MDLVRDRIERVLRAVGERGAALPGYHPDHGWVRPLRARRRAVRHLERWQPIPRRRRPETAEEYLARYPRAVAHVICGSLG